MASVSPPPPPEAPRLTAGDRRLEVSWSPPSSDGGARIDDYDVQFRTFPGGSWRQLPDTVKSTATTATIPGLQNGTEYEVQVRAGNSAGDGAWSASSRGTPMASVSPPPPPEAPRLTAGDRRLEVSWSPPSSDGGAPIVDYDVRYRAGDGGPWNPRPDTVNSTATTDTIPDLTNGTEYEVQVRAGNSAGDGAWSASSRGTPMASVSPPPPPEAPRLTAGDRRLEVSWSPPSSDGGAPIVDYDVRYRAGDGGPWNPRPDTVNSTATTDTIPDLTNGTEYEVQVRAGNSAGDGAWSASSRGTPMASVSPPPPPEAPRLTAGDRRLEVSWSPPSSDGGAPIVDYDVRYRAGDGGPWNPRPDTVNSTATTDTIPDLTNGTEYEVQVRAGNSAGDGAWSASSRGTPMASVSPPPPPEAPRLTAGDRRLEVSWSPPSSDGGAPIVDYDVRYRAGDGGPWNPRPDTVNSTATTDTIPDLTNGTEYEVQVRAGNSAGDGAWSASSRGTPMASVSPPPPPEAPRLTAGDRRLEVSWSPPSSDGGAPIVDYDVRYRAGDGGPWNPRPDTVNSTATTDTIPDLTNGTEYEVQVRAENSEGESDWSESGRGTPVADAAAPDRPAAPTVEPGDAGELKVSWIPPPDNGAPIEYYQLRFRAEDREAWLEPDNRFPPETKSVTAGNLMNGTEYEVQVRAVNAVGESDWSESGRGTPVADAAAPDRPAAPTVEPGDAGELKVSWIPPPDNGAPIEYYQLRARPEDEPDWIELPNELRGTSATLSGVTNGVTYEVQIRAVNAVGESDWSESGRGTPAAEDTADDRAVLMEFYRATNGPNWANDELWDSDLPLDFWHGVSADDNDRVTALRFGESNNMRGSLPSSLGNLTNLGSLSIIGDDPFFDPSVFENELTGPIPSSLGNLARLDELILQHNRLSGFIPAALCRFEQTINPQKGRDLPGCSSSVQVQLVPGDGQLRVDWARSDGGAAIDDYDVRYRPVAEFGVWTELPDATRSTETSATITGLTNGTAYQVQVRAVGAEGDGGWSAAVTGAPAAPIERLSFGDARIEDQRYRQHAAIAPLALPAATGGVGAVTYALSPALPEGLVFDAASRTISGAPTVATSPATYTYTATDSAGSPDQASLSFTLEVEVSAEEAALRRDALAAQGRALLSSVTGVIGERFRPRPAGQEGDGRTRGAAGGLVEALASMLGLRSGHGAAGGGAAFMPGRGAGHAGPGGLSAVGSGAGPGHRPAWGAGGLGGLSAAAGPGGLRAGDWGGGAGAMPAVGSLGGAAGLHALGSSGLGDAMPALGHGSFGSGPDGWGRDAVGPVVRGAAGRRRRRRRRLEPLHGVGRGRPAVVQRLARRGPLQRRHAHALRGGGRPSGRRLAGGGGGGPQLGGGRLHRVGGRGHGGTSDDAADERVSLPAGPGDTRSGAVGHRGLRPGRGGRRAGHGRAGRGGRADDADGCGGPASGRGAGGRRRAGAGGRCRGSVAVGIGRGPDVVGPGGRRAPRPAGHGGVSCDGGGVAVRAGGGAL